jgi:hypothetical protein
VIRRRHTIVASAVNQPGAQDGAPPDSGLRLLIARSGLLRWAPDPDAPALRALADGEVRLGIRCFEVTGGDLARVLGAGQGRPARSDARDWQALPAAGIAEVVESQAPGVSVGAMVRGRLRVGTHLVVQVTDTDSTGFGATDDAKDGSGARYAWSTAHDMEAAVGLDAVEQAIEALRDRSHAAALTCRLSLSPRPSSSGLGRPISDASWPCPLQRRPAPDSSIGRPAM